MIKKVSGSEWFAKVAGGWLRRLLLILLVGVVFLCVFLVQQQKTVESNVQTLRLLSNLELAILKKSNTVIALTEKIQSQLGPEQRAKLLDLKESYVKRIDTGENAEILRVLSESVEQSVEKSQAKVSQISYLILLIVLLSAVILFWHLGVAKRKFDQEFLAALRKLASHWSQSSNLHDGAKNSEVEFEFLEMSQLHQAYKDMADRTGTHLSHELSSTRVATLGEMASSLAREVSGPLTNIRMYAELAQKHGDDQSKAAVETILSNSIRIQKLVESTLSFAKDSHNLKKIFSL